ncbi:unnamed protein product, partial [Rotaria magnacalcarata]
MIMSDRTFE